MSGDPDQSIGKIPYFYFLLTFSTFPLLLTSLAVIGQKLIDLLRLIGIRMTGSFLLVLKGIEFLTI